MLLKVGTFENTQVEMNSWSLHVVLSPGHSEDQCDKTEWARFSPDSDSKRVSQLVYCYIYLQWQYNMSSGQNSLFAPDEADEH